MLGDVKCGVGLYLRREDNFPDCRITSVKFSNADFHKNHPTISS